MAKSYVKFATPGDVQAKALEAIEIARNSGSVRKGTNEATKAIERGEAKLVVIAEDVDPEEIVMHLPEICAEKRIPFAYVASKAELGKAAGLGVGTAAIAINNAGANDAALKEVLTKIRGFAAPAEKPKEEEKPKKAPAAKKPKEKKGKEEKTEEVKKEEKTEEAKE